MPSNRLVLLYSAGLLLVLLMAGAAQAQDDSDDYEYVYQYYFPLESTKCDEDERIAVEDTITECKLGQIESFEGGLAKNDTQIICEGMQGQVACVADNAGECFGKKKVKDIVGNDNFNVMMDSMFILYENNSYQTDLMPSCEGFEAGPQLFAQFFYMGEGYNKCPLHKLMTHGLAMSECEEFFFDTLSLGFNGTLTGKDAEEAICLARDRWENECDIEEMLECHDVEAWNEINKSWFKSLLDNFKEGIEDWDPKFKWNKSCKKYTEAA